MKSRHVIKNPNNPSSIDVILTNRAKSFQNSITIETGLSDHHKMILTVLNTYVKKRDPTVIKYRNYKNFDENLFRYQLIDSLQNIDKTIMKYDEFNECFMNALDKHAPMKKKTLRGNNAPFMNKTLTKAFMHRSKLKNKYNKNPNEINKTLYKKQRNICVSLLKKEKRQYYNNLDVTIFDDNRKFWKRIKPLFSDQNKTLPKDIILINEGVVISDRVQVANTLNNFFVDAVGNLEIKSFYPLNANDPSNKTIEYVIRKYEFHPSIRKIKENIKVECKFSFKDTTPVEFGNEILQLDAKKACLHNDIPIKILKTSSDVSSKFLSEIYNDSKNRQDFPLSLKLANVIPIHKAKEKSLS